MRDHAAAERRATPVVRACGRSRQDGESVAKKKPPLLGPDLHKLQPLLRMIANGDEVVNARRAQQSAFLAVADEKLRERVSFAPDDAPPLATRSQLDPGEKRGTLEQLATGVQTDIFIQTVDLAEPMPELAQVSAHKGNLATATVSLAGLRQLAADRRVMHVEPAQSLAAPRPDVSPRRVKRPRANVRRVRMAKTRGKGVLVGIIDVEGFDFAHPDFLDAAGHTRWERIWDQGGDARPSPSAFGYGAEFRREHLNAAIAAAGQAGASPQDLERQSQQAEGSHGTHVASIAAGNLGVCPEATLAGVLIALPASDEERRVSFYDSTRIAHAVDYLVNLATELKLPLSINISLGTNGHAHDTSAAINRWIDTSLALPGRSVCVAAGNAGQEIAAFEGDIGYTLGRIHTSGRVSAGGLTTDIEWVVVGNGIVDISENELELWFSPQDRFAVSVRPPGTDAPWIGPIEPRQFIENQQLKDGSFLSVYNELYHPANGANYIAIYLSPFFGETHLVGVSAGSWLIRLHGREVRDGRYHGWIERDDPRPLGRVARQEAWSFPSFFAERSNVDDSSVSTLACGQRIISVANLDAMAERIALTSSQGPTRDGRFKPDVAAPGTDIVAAKGFAGEDDLWVEMSGTSMASPYVAGVVGLMLAVQPDLTAAQIAGIIQRTAKPLPGAGFAWATSAGFGRINPDECLTEAAAANTRRDVTP
jgi:subtilisin family serine protease